MFRAWDHGSETLALCVGDAWLPEETDDAAYEEDNLHAGIALVNVLLGTCSMITLPLQHQAAEDPQGGRGPNLYGFSSSGLLLVAHNNDQNAPQLSAFDRSGRCVSTAAAPVNSRGTSPDYAIWAPASDNVLLWFHQGQDLWLWQVMSPSIQRISLGPREILETVFSPDGSCVLGLHEQGVSLLSVQDLFLSFQQLPELQQGGELVWGQQHIAVLAGYYQRVNRLLVYSMQDSTLTLVLSLGGLQWRGLCVSRLKAFSPDGSHLLVHMTLPPGTAAAVRARPADHLNPHWAALVLDPATGAQRQYIEPALREATGLRWCPAGTSIHCSSFYDDKHLMLDFS